MSNVNADLGELLQAANSIKTAISSIETTKSSMSRKYQQLGSEWKDKKYKELGNIVQECNMALAQILNILAKGDNFLIQLTKSLQDYEDVTLSGSHSNLELPQSANYFAGLPIRRCLNGTWGVMSSTLQAYDDYLNDIDNYTCENFDVVESRTIDAREIAGIDMISDNDLQNPQIFWGRSGGTYETFEAIARQIPEVQMRLNNGESLSDLIDDDQVGRCAALFFNTNSIDHPTVYEGNGFYELSGGGRHRIMLAQRFGYSIPVRVRGRIVHR